MMKRYLCLSILVYSALFQVDLPAQADQRQTPKSPERRARRSQQRSNDLEKNQTEPKMTREQMVASWKEERVMLLRFSNSSYQERYVRWRLKDNTKQPLTHEKYAGRTGIIIESKMTNGHLDLVVALDESGEKITLQDPWGLVILGFFAEMEHAKSLIGRDFWTKSPATLLYNCLSVEYLDREKVAPETMNIGRLSKLRVTRAEWRTVSPFIALYFKTEGGQEICYPQRYVLISRFHFFSINAGGDEPSYANLFYLQDPHKQFPNWSKTIWRLIEKGEVAIGMTKEMAQLACGGELEPSGVALSQSGNAVLSIYACGGKRFLIERGKVTKYIEER